MTILGIKSQLITHFSTHDTFDPEKHAFEVIYDKETADYREELLLLALGQLEAMGLVTKIVKGDSAIWVLALPIELIPQAVYLDRDLGSMIAECIDYYNEIDGIDVKCDPHQIDSADIGRLIDIIQNWEDGTLEHIKGGDDNESGPDLSQYKPGVN